MRIILPSTAISWVTAHRGGGDAMQVMERQANEVMLVGRLDARAAGPVRDALHAALSAGSGPLVVDISGVELLDATGLGVLVGAHRRARLDGRELVLRGPSHRVARLLTVTRLDRVITLAPAVSSVPA